MGSGLGLRDALGFPVPGWQRQGGTFISGRQHGATTRPDGGRYVMIGAPDCISVELFEFRWPGLRTELRRPGV